MRTTDPKFNSLARTGRRFASLAVALAVAVLAAPGGTTTAGAQSNDEIIRQSEQTINESRQRIAEREREREELREEANAATASLDIAQATADDLVAALEAVRASVNAQHEAWANAERALLESEQELREAQVQVDQLEAEIEQAKVRLHDSLVDSYVNLQSPEGSLNVLGDDLWENSRQQALTGFATGTRIDHIDELRRLGAELERWRLIAEQVTTDAADQRASEAELLEQLQIAQDREYELMLEAEARLEMRLYEVQTLKELDATFAAQIEREERRVADALSRQRAAEEAKKRAEEQARLAAQAPTQPANSDFTLVWVSTYSEHQKAIQVNTDIAEGLRGLLAAMEAEGFSLGGWGYRTHQAQINLRRSYCGTSEYAIWQMPSSQCRPNVARPGRSNHERGLAVDFTLNGRVIGSRSSAVFQALQRLAPQYGLHNLPSEPWHWSINGR